MIQLLSGIQNTTAALQAEQTRLDVISENIANFQSTANVAGGDPYVRKTISFDNEMDRSAGVDLVRVKTIGTDPTPYKLEQDPGNPAADAQGFVKMPNVDLLIELADMREVNRTYEANLQVAKQSADMMNQTVNLLKDA